MTKTWVQPKTPSMDEWMKKIGSGYTTECNLTFKKKEVLSQEDIMLSETSQA
jgi:hypothetical protein